MGSSDNIVDAVISSIRDEINVIIKTNNNINTLAQKWGNEINKRNKLLYSAALSHVTRQKLHRLMTTNDETKKLDYDEDSLNKLRDQLRQNIADIIEIDYPEG